MIEKVYRTVLRFKRAYVSQPTKFFLPLTFAELEVGEKFIRLPEPRKNDGRGSGFRDTYTVFTKIRDRVGGDQFGLPYFLPCGRAKSDNGTEKDFSHYACVIRLK